MGGDRHDIPHAVTVDENGNICICGRTENFGADHLPKDVIGINVSSLYNYPRGQGGYSLFTNPRQ